MLIQHVLFVGCFHPCIILQVSLDTFLIGDMKILQAFTAWYVSVCVIIMVLIQCECGKIWTRITPNTNSCYAMFPLPSSNSLSFPGSKSHPSLLTLKLNLSSRHSFPPETTSPRNFQQLCLCRLNFVCFLWICPMRSYWTSRHNMY